jgi:hypothetical protein
MIALAAVAGVAWAARLAALWLTRPPFAGVYWTLSDDILQHAQLGFDGTPSTDFEPLYPLFLAAARLIAGGELAVQIVQAGVAAAGAAALFALTNTLTGSRRAATIAALLYAFYPLLVRHSIDLGDTALLTTLLVAFAAAWMTSADWPRAAFAGLILGFAVLTRVMTLPLVVIGFVLLLRDRGLPAASAFGAAALVLVVPFTMRNYSLNGALMPTRSGWNLFIGNCEYVVLPEHGPDVLNGYVSTIVVRAGLAPGPESPIEERDTDRVLRQHALRYMRDHPAQTLLAKLRNIGYMFTPRLVPYREPTEDTTIRFADDGTLVVEHTRPRPLWHQVVHGVSYVAVMAAAAIGFYKRRAFVLRRDAMLWAIVATFVGVHALYFPSTRYLAPISFVWLFYAAAAIAEPPSHARASR